MKKIVVAVALAAFASTASAAIAGGSHDLTTRAGASSTFGTCQFCHAPHFANTSANYATIPLWNRSTPNTSTYQFRTLAVGVLPAQLGAGSYTCLSCHDGVSDMGQTYSGSKGFTAVTTLSGYANVGATQAADGTRSVTAGLVDLRDDHPVGVQFNPGAGATDAMKALTDVTAAGLKLYQYTAGVYTVECGSCHDPHGVSDGARGGAAFLRASGAGICGACHNK